MAEWIKQVAKAENIDVVVPDKGFVSYDNVVEETDPTRKYCVVCEKIDVLSGLDTFMHIAQMGKRDQIAIANEISRLVTKTGLTDASFGNIRLLNGELENKRFAIIDTEPVGLMVPKKPGLWNRFFGPNGMSVEKGACIGLANLL